MGLIVPVRMGLNVPVAKETNAGGEISLSTLHEAAEQEDFHGVIRGGLAAYCKHKATGRQPGSSTNSSSRTQPSHSKK